MGAGQALPIWRGGGVNQRLLLDFARHVAAGKWCHVFPEAGVWQDEWIGGRQGPDAATKGRLKWGIGKLIAHAPSTPTVIPFFHTGMDGVTPLDPETKKLLLPLPVPGARVKVRFGPAIDFSDLVEAHEKQYGPLWKYTSSHLLDEPRVAINSGGDSSSSSSSKSSSDGGGGSVVKAGSGSSFHAHWDSSESDLLLYHKITLRIEEAMLDLNRQANNEQK